MQTTAALLTKALSTTVKRRIKHSHNCGVNAHFQNGVAEKKIKDLQEKTRTCLLYAMHKWPRMVIANLWPYALRYVNDVTNTTLNKGEEITPLEKFSSVSVAPKIRHFHSFGCPAYVLDNTLQSGQGLPKWSSRSGLGVYLGASPSHARSVTLILNPRTGHVSPQFHVKFDDYFETIKAKSMSFDQPDPEWKYLSGFAVSKEKKKQRQAVSSTDHPQGSLSDSSTPSLPQEQPMDLPQTPEGMTQGQDMDHPFVDNSGTTESSPLTPQAEP